MARSSTATNTSRWVYTTGTSYSERANSEKPAAGADAGAARTKGLMSRAPALPSQQYTFQRGMALAALELPEEDRQEALAEVLDMLQLRHRVAPRPKGRR